MVKLIVLYITIIIFYFPNNFFRHDIQRRFGSLKKLGSRKNSGSNQFPNSNNGSSEVASLDRKYLRFLGQKSSPTPVPTSRFRSYRRMHPTPTVLPKGGNKIYSLSGYSVQNCC